MPFLNVELMLIDGCLKYGHFSLGWAPMSTNMWTDPPHTHTCTNWTEWVIFLLSVELLGRQEICWQGWWKLEGRNGEWIRLRYVAHAHEIFKRKFSEICRQRQSLSTVVSFTSVSQGIAECALSPLCQGCISTSSVVSVTVLVSASPLDLKMSAVSDRTPFPALPESTTDIYLSLDGAKMPAVNDGTILCPTPALEEVNCLCSRVCQTVQSTGSFRLSFGLPMFME